MRADLHYHGLIGFHEPWISLQGYKGKNLAEEIFNVASKKEVEMLAIISEQTEIEKGSFHDRFNYLFYEAQKLPKDKYTCEKLGNKDISFCLERKEDNKRLFVLNGQTVIIKEKDSRFDHLVIGNNQVPNQRNWKETISFCRDKGLIQIAEKPYCNGYFGIPEEILMEYLREYDAVEGHNSQIILPFGSLSKKSNEQAQAFAIKNSKPWVATSDAHRIKDLAISYIAINGNYIDCEKEENQLNELKTIIEISSFVNHTNYESFFGWVQWVSTFVGATKMGLDKYSIK
jgi:hypothetical protein